MGVDCLKGQILTRVYKHYPGNFTFEFGVATLTVDCLWRVRKDNHISLTSNDAGQKFGLPAPVDACLEAASLLKSRQIIEVRLNESSADLTLQLDGEIQLEIITHSSGYEPWNLRAPGVHLVALGGGGIADFSVAGE